MVEVEVREKMYRKQIDNDRRIEVIVRRGISWEIKEIKFIGGYREYKELPIWTLPYLIEVLVKIREDFKHEGVIQE